MNAPLIKPNASRSAGSTAVLEYLARIWPLGACRSALVNVFAQADAQTTATGTLAKRIDAALANMVGSRMLSREGKGTDRKWSLGPAAELTGPHQPHKPHQPPAYVGERVAARQSDVMPTSVYRPTPWGAARAGSDDFTRCPSLHQGRRLPFTGNYVGVTRSKS